MKILAPLSFLLLTQSASALELKDILKGISQTPELVVNQCDQDSDEDLLHQCAVDFCGPPETAPIATVNDRNFDLLVKPEVKERLSEIDESVKKMYEVKKKNLESLVQEIEERLKKKPAALRDFSKWDRDQITNLSDALFLPQLSLRIDKKRPFSDRVSVNFTIPDNATDAFKKGLEAYAKGYQEQLLRSPADGISAGLYTREEALTRLKALAKDFYQEFETASKRIPRVLEDDEKVAVQRFKDIEKLSLTTLQIGEAYREVENLFNKVTQSTGRSRRFQHQERCSHECRKQLENYFKAYDYKKNLNALFAKSKEYDLESAKASCQSELIEKALKASEKEKFLELYPDIKKNFMTNVLRGYSDHSKKAFSEYLDNEVHLSFVASEQIEVDDIIEKMNQKFAETEEKFRRKEHTSELLTEFISQAAEDDLEAFLPDLGCEEQSNFALWDAFSPSDAYQPVEYLYDKNEEKDNLDISLFSCTHSLEGRGIVSHEIGHALSYAFKRGKLSKESEVAYDNFRNCATELYLSPLPIKDRDPMWDREGDSLRTEEDMADVASYMATKADESLFSCALFDTNKEGNQYTNLALENADLRDVHSSNLLRALNEAISKKKELSPACRAVIHNNSNKFRFKSCI